VEFLVRYTFHVRKFSSFLLAILIASGCLSAQTRKAASKPASATNRKLVAINVTGTQNYKPAEILFAAGLEIGQTVDDADFKTAAQHLADTGAFSDISYSFRYSEKGTEVDYTLADASPLVPARFDNFVWLSDEELLARIHSQVPMFHGKLPLGGNLIDQVSDALQTILVEKNIPARADYLRSGAQDGPIDSIVYSVSGVHLRVRKVDFRGASDTERPLLETAAKTMQNSEYSRSILTVQAQKNLLPIYLERGYLKAEIGAPEAKVGETTEEQTLVDVTFPVSVGAQYKFEALDIAGNSAVPTNQIQQCIHLKPGDPVNAVELDRDMHAIRKLYTTHGYMAVDIRPSTQLNDANGTVHYTLQIAEGDQYKMGELDIQGLDKATNRKMFDLWKLLGGDSYDSSYASRFLNDRAVVDLIGNVRMKTETLESTNKRDLTVDVTIRFTPQD
jgi:outer membrane protein assembly factor BamA